MAKDPAFLFYPNDYIGGTMGMTFEEKGAYMELLMMQFNRGHMTSHMIGQVVGQLWVNIKHKFVQDEQGLWYNKRLDDEKYKRKAFTDSRKNNIKGKNQHSNKTKKHGHMDGHMTSHMENENVNENISRIDNESFEVFWDEYHKKTGKQKTDKEPAIKKWRQLTKQEKRMAFDSIDSYVKVNDKRYLKKARTYLGDKSFKDEFKQDQKVTAYESDTEKALADWKRSIGMDD